MVYMTEGRDSWTAPYEGAMHAAAVRIGPARRRLSDHQAEQIVAEEFLARGIDILPSAAISIARSLRHPFWPFLHPSRPAEMGGPRHGGGARAATSRSLVGPRPPRTTGWPCSLAQKARCAPRPSWSTRPSEPLHAWRLAWTDAGACAVSRSGVTSRRMDSSSKCASTPGRPGWRAGSSEGPGRQQ